MKLRSRRRSNPAETSAASLAPGAKVALVATGIVGVGVIVMLARKSAAAATSAPSSPSGVTYTGSTWSTPAPTSSPSSGVGFGVNVSGSQPSVYLDNVSGAGGGTDRVTALIARLRSDPNALQIYAFQALEYELGLSNQLPDGIMGPVTTSAISSLQARDNLPVTGTFSSNLIAAIVDATSYSAGSTVRMIPDPIPSDLVAQMNAYLASQVPDNAPTISTAGQ